MEPSEQFTSFIRAFFSIAELLYLKAASSGPVTRFSQPDGQASWSGSKLGWRILGTYAVR